MEMKELGCFGGPGSLAAMTFPQFHEAQDAVSRTTGAFRQQPQKSAEIQAGERIEQRARR
jgi:hypothetical protein